MGQTGRGVTDRTREHADSLRGDPSGDLAVHCNKCGCEPVWNNLAIVHKYKNKIARAVLGAFLIHSLGNLCLSAPSLGLIDDKFA